LARGALAGSTFLADAVVFAAALAAFSTAALGVAVAAGSAVLSVLDFFTLLVAAEEAAALGLATGVVRAEAGLLVSFLDAGREASDWVVFDFAPALAPLRDDLAVEGILRYSLCHPALETGRAAAHPAVNGSETLARTSCARRPQGPIRRPGCKFRKKGHGLWREAWPKPGK
jgi:hypothetical protein